MIVRSLAGAQMLLDMDVASVNHHGSRKGSQNLKLTESVICIFLTATSLIQFCPILYTPVISYNPIKYFKKFLK